MVGPKLVHGGVQRQVQDSIESRVRVTFAVDLPLCYSSVLDMGRMWERLLRRAQVPIAYSQGFRPHARLQLAAALPVGYTSHCESLDILLVRKVDCAEVLSAVRQSSPPGLAVLDARPVPVRTKSPQSTMREAQYSVCLWSEVEPERIEGALLRLLERPSIARQRMKKRGRIVDYDLRPLILALEYSERCPDHHVLSMNLRCGSSGSGRPEEIMSELGFEDERVSICRVRLIWGEGKDGPG